MKGIGVAAHPTSARSCDGCRGGARLWVVDLSTSERARWLVRWAATLSMRWVLATTPRREKLCAVVLAPGTSAAKWKWPAGLHVLRPTDALTGAERRQVHEWVRTISVDIVQGEHRGLFPEVLGVDLGQLNLVAIQSYLEGYRLLWATIEALLGRVPVERCYIFSGDRGLATALHKRSAARIPRVSSWSPDLLRRLVHSAAQALLAPVARRGRRGDPDLKTAARTIIRGHGLRDDVTAQILLVSDSVPIAETLRTVEARLQEAGLGPVITVDLGGKPGRPLDQSTRIRVFLGTYGQGADLGSEAARVHVSGLSRGACRPARVSGDEEVVGLTLGVLGRLAEAQVFNRQVGHLYVVEAVLDALRPQLVVVGNDRWWGGQAFVQLARLRGIPSLCVQDGVAADEPTWWWATADRVATSGEMLARLLVQHGMSPSRVVVTGQPRYDQLSCRRAPVARRASRPTLGLDQMAFVVLFATQEGQDPEYVRSVVAAILAVPEVRLLLRPHPAEPHVLHSRLVKADQSARTTLHRRENIYDLVDAADVLVTQYSTVALEASVMGTAVILADFSAGAATVPYLQLGIGTVARSPQELVEVLRRLVATRGDGMVGDHARVVRALQELAGPLDGRAGERVARTIAEMLSGSHPGAARLVGQPLVELQKSREESNGHG